MDDIVQIVERGEADMARGFFPQPDGDLGNTYQNAQAQTAAEGASETESLNDQVIGQTGITKPNPYEAQTSQPGTEFSATWAQTTISTSETSTAQSTATESPDNTDTGASNSLSSTKTELAIALPISIVGLLVIGALIFFFLRRRKRRNTVPAYDIATGQQRGISTSELMAVQKVETSNPGMSSISHFPGSVTNISNRGLDLDPSSVRPGVNDSHTELGLTIAVPMDQRRSASQQDLPRFSGTASMTSTPRMPFDSRDGEEDDDDDISIVSRRNRERDFDDMSSVSSFEDNGDEHRGSGNGNGNGHGNLR
ncbi:hypothetical protein N7450_006373 [Penicillium hetheringtonii]|uniref:Uncharacterized protein n=1 Tax=Penicillium hetheringtonii TaxID=911720 RepID=A0AAD6DK65_9EURO|nr:hypothetical protein N7450_006373 [Penicillium hetheringtonii]